MKLLIQLTFNNGLGNLYCGAVEILNFVNHYHELGYECNLIFASNGHRNGNKFIGQINFDEIFDTDSFKFFKNIENVTNSIHELNYKGFKYHSSQYGPTTPGIHWWDVFFDELPSENIYPKYTFDMGSLIDKRHVPIFLPKLNKGIYKKKDEFLQGKNNLNNCIQIRYDDYTLNPKKEFIDTCYLIKEKISSSEKFFYISSNNQFAIDTLNNFSNVIIYPHKYLDILSNDHSYYFYNKNLPREVLLERLYDNFAEMVILSSFDNIFFYTSFSWISSFLYYSKSHNQKQNLIDLREKITLD